MRKHRRPRREIVCDDAGVRKLRSAWFSLLRDGLAMDKITIGIDEVGNGALYGPIAVAGVINLTGWHLPGVKDSKKVRSEARRQVLAGEIRHNTVWCLAMVLSSNMDRFGGAGPTLDALNVHVARSLVARVREVYPTTPIEVVMDGQGESRREGDYYIRHLPKADALVYEVSAASLLAKVAVDDWITRQVKAQPDLGKYGLTSSRGYGTPEHTAALLRFGPTPEHRQDACKTRMKNEGRGHGNPPPERW
jgi:ribonuclease HII